MKSKDNKMIWEAYMGPTRQEDLYNDEDETNIGSLYDEDEGADMDMMGDGDAELSVMSFEPIDEVHPVDSGDEYGDSRGSDEHCKLDIAVYSDIKKLAEYSKRIHGICQEVELEPWMQAQLVKAASYVSDVWHQLDAGADFANTGFEQSDNIDL